MSTADSFDEGFADSGQVTAERGEVEAIVGTLRDTLNEIDDALAKLEAGTYGLCEIVRRPIAEARLEAMPIGAACASRARPSAADRRRAHRSRHAHLLRRADRRR